MAGILCRGLSEAGYAVDAVGDGTEAVWMATENAYDGIVLDVMLPGTDGFGVCQTLRERLVWTPVLMLTARDAVPDRVRGLDVGADDYLVKPFAFEEFLARLRAVIRRGPNERPARVRVADLMLDPASRTVERDGRPIHLTPKEFALLECLMLHHGRVLSRTQIVEHVWDWAFDGTLNVVDVHIRSLRSKVDDPFAERLIRTVRGAGYMLESR
jgi:two-component system OmpR family response regulator